MDFHIVTLPGDGIGPEVIGEAVRVLGCIGETYGHRFRLTEHLIGGCSMDRHGAALTDEVLDACRAADAVLLGAVGGPKWDDPTAAMRPEVGLLGLRKGLATFANLRPARPYPALADTSPLRREKLAGVDLLVLRELTGGLYFGKPKCRQRENGHVRAVDTMAYTDAEIRRVVALACELARARRGRVTSVDKANVLETSRLWRQVATEVAADYPDIVMDHMLADTCAMRLIAAPASFDVIVTENTFGDILTDEASVLTGSMGMLPSASLGSHAPGLYEPVHGSAPDIAGKGIANPVGAILSVAMLLRHSLRLEEEARAVEAAVESAIADGCRTADLGGTLGTREMGNQVIGRIGDCREDPGVWLTC